MSHPLISIIIPTHNRPHLLPKAVESALNQTYQALEVIVVDDGSQEQATLPDDPRLRVIYLDKNVGGAAARNVGTKAASGRWVTYLDDDDYLLPQMVEISLSTLEKTTVEPPVAVISALQKVDETGKVIATRIPPALCPQGDHFFLETPEPGRSFHTKQTLVVERDLILKIGGWDETFRSRVHSELFLRLNLQCTIIGLPKITYHLFSHSTDRVSGNYQLRQESFQRLIKKHEEIFSSHPKMFAEFVYKHALKSYKMQQKKAALIHLLWALKLHPTHTFFLIYRSILSQLSTRFPKKFLIASNSS